VSDQEPIAFSSDVDAGSREENAPQHKHPESVLRMLAGEPNQTSSVTPLRPRAAAPTPAPAPSQTAPSAPLVVTFDRTELREILNLYGRKVAEGEWRDYAMDFTPNKAVFSVYRRTSEFPLYRIEKDPKLARKQGAYCVVAATGLILRRGPDLARVVAVLDRKVKLVGG
jgi:hypothetical protein